MEDELFYGAFEFQKLYITKESPRRRDASSGVRGWYVRRELIKKTSTHREYWCATIAGVASTHPHNSQSVHR